MAIVTLEEQMALDRDIDDIISAIYKAAVTHSLHPFTVRRLISAKIEDWY